MSYTGMSESYERGFTLIELLVVVIIIGVIAAMAYPSMSSQIANMRINSAKTTIASAIKDAQAQSSILRRPIWIVFTNSEGKVSIALSTTETPTDATTLATHKLPNTARLVQDSGGTFRVTPAGILQKKEGSDYAPAIHVFYVCDTLRSGNTVIGLKYQNRSTPIAQAQTTESTVCSS